MKKTPWVLFISIYKRNMTGKKWFNLVRGANYLDIFILYRTVTIGMPWKKEWIHIVEDDIEQVNANNSKSKFSILFK